MKKKITPTSAREFLNAVKLPSPTRGAVEGVREIIDFTKICQDAPLGRAGRNGSP